MKNEWTEQDLRQFVESSRPVFQDVSLTQVDEDADRCWQDDGLMVDYELRGGQVDCVLRRCVVADGKVWQLQMTAPLAGNDLPEDRMTPREREMCRDDMNHDFVTGVFNRRYYETEFCTKLDEWTDCHRCAALALVSIDGAEKLSARESDAVMGQLVCFVANQWKKHFRGKVFATIVPRNVRLGEAPSHALPINRYDPRSTGAEAYRALAREVMARNGDKPAR